MTSNKPKVLPTPVPDPYLEKLEKLLKLAKSIGAKKRLIRESEEEEKRKL